MRWRGVVFALVCAFWLAVSPVAAFLALMAPKLADAGLGPATWVLMTDFFTLPAACVLAPVAAGIAYRKGRRRLAWGLVCLPLLWLVIPAVVWSVI